MLNPHTPVAQIVAYEIVFQRFQGEEVEFFKSDLTDPLRFLMRIFWKIPIKPFQLSFLSGFLYQDHVLSHMVLKLIRTNEIEEKKRCLFTPTNL